MDNATKMQCKCCNNEFEYDILPICSICHFDNSLDLSILNNGNGKKGLIRWLNVRNFLIYFCLFLFRPYLISAILASLVLYSLSAFSDKLFPNFNFIVYVFFKLLMPLLVFSIFLFISIYYFNSQMLFKKITSNYKYLLCSKMRKAKKMTTTSFKKFKCKNFKVSKLTFNILSFTNFIFSEYQLKNPFVKNIENFYPFLEQEVYKLVNSMWMSGIYFSKTLASFLVWKLCNFTGILSKLPLIGASIFKIYTFKIYALLSNLNLFIKKSSSNISNANFTVNYSEYLEYRNVKHYSLENNQHLFIANNNSEKTFKKYCNCFGKICYCNSKVLSIDTLNNESSNDFTECKSKLLSNLRFEINKTKIKKSIFFSPADFLVFILFFTFSMIVTFVRWWYLEKGYGMHWFIDLLSKRLKTESLFLSLWMFYLFSLCSVYILFKFIWIKFKIKFLEIGPDLSIGNLSIINFKISFIKKHFLNDLFFDNYTKLIIFEILRNKVTKLYFYSSNSLTFINYLRKLEYYINVIKEKLNESKIIFVLIRSPKPAENQM